MSIRVKLLLMVGLPVIALAAISAIGLSDFYKISNDVGFMNTLHLDRAQMINADRDAYQAQMSLFEAMEARNTDTLKQALADAKENIDQTWQRISEPAKHFTPDMAPTFESFTGHFNAWKKYHMSFFDLSAQTLKADLDREKEAELAVASFDAMRTYIDQLGEIVTTGLDDPELNMIDRVRYENAQSLILNADRDAYQALVATMKLAGVNDEEGFTAEAGSFAENADQTKDRVVRGADLIGYPAQELKEGFLKEYETWHSHAQAVLTRTRDNLAKNIQKADMLKGADHEFGIMRGAIDELGNKQLARVEARLADLESGINTTIKTYLIIAAAALLASILLSLIMSAKISSALRKTMDFAKAVAGGNFNASLDVRQKDEVGQVADAVRHIPEVLDRLRSEMLAMTDKVDRGGLRTRGDASHFEGSFRELMENVNLVADVMLGYLESVPMPLMTLNPKHKILFMNKAAAEVAESTPETIEGAKCHDIMRTGDCNTENCACDRAMEAGEKITSETDAHPEVGELEIRYIGVPTYTREGELVGAFELVIDQTEIVRSQRKIRQVAKQVAEITERLSSASSEISSQVESSSQGAATQRDRSTEAATAMEEMNATVLEVAQNASSAAENAESAKNQALEGSNIVKNVVDAVRRVEKQSMSLKTNMESLGEKAEDIGRIMNVITDIADQTNLLALNAAIEAARAGDAGRGFAVVADEVRKLAEKTMNATHEVGDSINAIQTNTRQNVEDTERAVEGVVESTNLAEQAGTSLKEIVDVSERTADQVRAIATAAEEQSSASEEITRATDEINSISSQTADAMDQSSQAVRELARLASELQTMIEELSSES